MKTNWQTKKLGDENILKMTSGGTPSRSNSGFYNGDILWLKSGELNDNENILDSEEKISEGAVKNSSAKIFPKGTVLFAMYGATAGKIGILAVEATTNQAVAGMITNEEVLYNRYLYYFLTYERTKIISRAWGGAQPNLSQTILKEIEIPLPPLEEQKEIVKMLDEKMGMIGEAKRLRAEALADTEKILPQTLHEIFEEGKKKFVMADFGEVAKLVRGPFGGSLKKEIFVSNGDCVYEQGNVIDNDLENFRYFVTHEKFEEMKRFEVLAGDILMSCSGTIGKFVIIPRQFKKGIINQALLKITPKETISVDYLKYALQDYLSLSTTHVKGATIKNIASVKELKQFQIPLPPLAEQQKIVAKLDTISEKVRTLRALQTTQLADLKSLEKAYLREAFLGDF